LCEGYYLDLTIREGVNEPLRAALSARRLVTGRDRDRSTLGHLATSMPSNVLSHGAPPRRHPRLLPEGAASAMLAAVRTARDRMIVTWLADSGPCIGELCGVWFCDLHLRTDHPCGERKSPHVHIVRRRNTNGASAKTGRPVLHAVEDEPVQVLAVPAERGLHDGVQAGDRGVGSDEQAPPDQRTDPVHHSPQLINGRGCVLRVLRHDAHPHAVQTRSEWPIHREPAYPDPYRCNGSAPPRPG
jgi:hypothetical protein